MPHLHSDLTGRIIRCAHSIYNHLGTGFQEHVYQMGLAVELLEGKLKFRLESPIQIVHKGYDIGDYRADVLVEDQVLVELKAVETLLPVHSAQLLNYMRFGGKQIGLLINFGWHKVEVKRRILTSTGHFAEPPDAA
jgi:GxxExxY protein